MLDQNLTFQHRRKRHKRLRIRHRKPIRALRHGLHSRLLQRPGQKRHVRRLILRNRLQIRVERVCEAGADKFLVGIVREPLAVELVFKMLQRECIVEDIRWKKGKESVFLCFPLSPDFGDRGGQ